MGTGKHPKIIFIMDYQISRERAGLISRIIHGLKRYFEVDLVQNAEFKETELLRRLELNDVQAVIAPFRLYLSWHKVEGFFGMNRTHGPAFAGYLAEPTAISDLPPPDSQLRRILLDFVHLDTAEITTLIHSLVYEERRSGLTPLLEPQVPIFYENWYGRQDHGKRVEHFLELPEIKSLHWTKRSSAIRIILNALWSLIYEEGPGKRERVLATSQAPMASFQVGADSHILAFRLYYHSHPKLSPKDVIRHFWPDPTVPTKAAQLLLTYSDFIRVSSFMEMGDIEVVVGLTLSGPSEKTHLQARTLWIEPLSPKLLLESPYQVPSGDNSRYKSLPDTITFDSSGNNTKPLEKPKLAPVISMSQKRLEQKNRALESAGIRFITKPSGPDPESLLEAFQQRYFEARQQIHQFEVQINNMEKKGARPQEIKTLQLKMEALMNRQKHWIKRLVEMLESYKKETISKNKNTPS